MIWACFTASGSSQLAIIDGALNSELHRESTGRCPGDPSMNWSLTESQSWSKTTTLNTQDVLPKNDQCLLKKCCGRVRKPAVCAGRPTPSLI